MNKKPNKPVVESRAIHEEPYSIVPLSEMSLRLIRSSTQNMPTPILEIAQILLSDYPIYAHGSSLP